MSNILQNYFSDEIVKGAILGSIIIPFILVLIKKILVYLISIQPKKLLFKKICSEETPCHIFFVRLYDVNRTNQYAYDLPDFFPPHTSNKSQFKINTPYVWAEADAQCALDVINILGSVGKTKNIFVKDPARDWDLWEGNIICIGGSTKVNATLERFVPTICELSSDKCKIKLPTGEELDAVAGDDFGLIQKMKNPINDSECWIIMGIGSLGTLAAGYYLRNYCKELGVLWENKPFACIVKARLEEGPEMSVIYKAWPKPMWYKKFFHPILWFKKYRKACLHKK